MIILIGGEKGGTGKTTIATNLAALRAIQKHDILIVDTDKQGSASAWSDIREFNKINIKVPTVQKFGKMLPEIIVNFKERYEDIIIDAGGRDSVELRAAMTIADVLFIPVQASQFDIWTLSIMNDLVQLSKTFNTKLKAYIVINRAATNPVINEVEEAKNVLHEFEHLYLSVNILKERICYRKAARSGLSIIEIEKQDQKALDEFTKLYYEVFNER